MRKSSAGIAWIYQKAAPGIFFSVLLGILSVGFNIALMGLAAYIIASASYHPELYVLMPYITGVRFFGTFRGVLRYLERVFSHRAALEVVSHIRTWYFRQINRHFSSVIREKKSALLYSEILRDVNALENGIVRFFLPMAIATGIYFFTSIFLYIYFKDILFFTIYLTGFLIIIAVIPMIAVHKQKNLGFYLGEKRRNLENFLIHFHATSGESTLYSFTEPLSVFFRKSLHDYESRFLELKNRNIFYSSIIFFLSHFVLFIVLSSGLLHNNLETTYFTVGILVIISSLEAYSPIAASVGFFTYYYDSLKNLLSLSSRSVSRNPARITHGDYPGMKSVSFKYGQEHPWILKNVSLALKPGKISVITGISGSGKSTLMSLLSGEILPAPEGFHGQIIHPHSEKSGIPLISRYSPRTYFFQDDLIFNLYLDSSRETLTPEAEKILEYLELDIPFLLAREKKLRENLSFGQKKRILLTRAFLSPSPYLFLDEPTEGLDFSMRLKINRYLQAMTPEKTIFIITHKMELLRIAHSIFRLSHGSLKKVALPEPVGDIL